MIKKTIQDYYNSYEKIDYVNINHEKGTISIICKIDCQFDLKKLNKIKSKIQSELDKIKDILKKSNINLTTVILNHHSNVFIEKEIILHLANENDNFNEFEIENLPDFNIEDRLMKLCSENIIIKSDSKFRLNETITTFETIFKIFEENGDLDIFYFTKYTENMIPKVFSKLNNKFGALYLENQNARIKLLKNSPTSAKLAFNFDEFLELYNFNIDTNQNGELVLDYLLLMSIFNDMKYYRENINFNEIETAITELNMKNYDLQSRVQQYKQFGEDHITIGENESTDNERDIEFSIKIRTDEKFEDMLTAAYKTGTPLKLLGDRIEEFKIEKNGEIETSSPDAVVFHPPKHHFDLKIGECWYNNIEFILQEPSEDKFKFTSTSDKIDVILEFIFDFVNNKISFTIMYKSNEIKDVFYWYLFKYQCSGRDLKIYYKNEAIFETELPNNDLTNEFIEYYRKLNKINDELKLNMIHKNEYQITNSDFESIDTLYSLIKNNSITMNEIKFPFRGPVEDLKKILENESKEFSSKLNYNITLLGYKIDLGFGETKITSFNIKNKENLLKIIKSKEIMEKLKLF